MQNNNKSNGATISSDSHRSKKNIMKKRRFPIFPQKLYDMLENSETNGYSHIISWLPNGKAFQIRGDEKAIVEVLRQCADFNLTRFKSFSRQLQLYGFQRHFKGKHQGECKHSLFIRGQKDLFKGKSMIDFQNATLPSTTISVGGGVIDFQKGILCQQEQEQQQQQVHTLSKEDKINYNDAINIKVNNNKEAVPIMVEPIPTRLENLILPNSSYQSKIHHRKNDASINASSLSRIVSFNGQQSLLVASTNKEPSPANIPSSSSSFPNQIYTGVHEVSTKVASTVSRRKTREAVSQAVDPITTHQQQYVSSRYEQPGGGGERSRREPPPNVVDRATTNQRCTTQKKVEITHNTNTHTHTLYQDQYQHQHQHHYKPQQPKQQLPNNSVIDLSQDDDDDNNIKIKKEEDGSNTDTTGNTNTKNNRRNSNVVVVVYDSRDPGVNTKKKKDENDPNNHQHHFLCQLLLQDTVIGHNASIQEMAQYATHFLALGLHSKEMILQMRKVITPQHIQQWTWMKPFHQVKFSQWLFS